MSSVKKKILLAGGSGYLGTHLGKTLSSIYQVFYTSATKKKDFIHLDFLDKATYKNIQEERFDIIILLASSLQGLGTRELKEEYLNIDTTGLLNFLQYISENKLSNKIIYTSSMTVYGIQNSVPVKEDGNLNPLSTYGLSKLLAEHILTFFCQTDNVKGVVFRIPGIYGGSRNSGFIYNAANKCKTHQTVEIDTSTLGYWETIHIDDLCTAISSFIEKYSWQDDFDVFNIGYGTRTDIIECAHLIKKTLGSNSEILATGKEGYVPLYLDNTKIKRFITLDNRYEESLKQYVKTSR